MLPRLHRGLLFTFEGGEGAGKTTLIDELARRLASEGYSTLKTREPGGTHVGELIRTMLLEHSSTHPLTPHAELCLFLASRAQHIAEVIVPALENRKIVLCDRFNDSTIAYQGYARHLGADEVAHFCRFISGKVQPDLTFYLDIDPKVGLMRARRDQPNQAGARGYDRIESEDLAFHQTIRDAFLHIHSQEPKRVIRLDAAQPPGFIADEVMKRIRTQLK